MCRKYVVKVLAQRLRAQLEDTVKYNEDPAGQTYSPDAKSAARRALKNKALAYLAALGDPKVTPQILERFRKATNMTDKISALAALIDSEGEQSTKLAAACWAADNKLVDRCQLLHLLQELDCLVLVHRNSQLIL